MKFNWISLILRITAPSPMHLKWKGAKLEGSRLGFSVHRLSGRLETILKCLRLVGNRTRHHLLGCLATSPLRQSRQIACEMHANMRNCRREQRGEAERFEPRTPHQMICGNCADQLS